ncbi:GTP-binding protein [Thioploca ingrica]|uniref:GTP-binding protein n=1 Tax=Thioploca ingrica TaxID=40754 RepID=A0A090AJZ9_9GAMM|nr:GTP-binding protein [Thioploca ingrica]
MIGDFAVGKTSLVARFVRQTFSDKYLTTIGVKIDTKLIDLSQEQIKLILWDIAGSDALSTVTASYLRGAAGYFLVVDGTRKPTWDNALNLQELVNSQIGNKPFILLLNKADLQEQWEINNLDIAEQLQQGRMVIHTSAKTGTGVEEAFTQLATKLLNNPTN